MKPIDKVNYEGVYWKGVKWHKPIHEMKLCDHCGGDMDHQNPCYYLEKPQSTPATQIF